MSDMVTVSIEGVLKPVQKPLPQAVVLAWQTLRALPLGSQYEAYRRFFGTGAQQRVREAFDQDGQLELTFQLEGELRSVRIEPVRQAARVR